MKKSHLPARGQVFTTLAFLSSLTTPVAADPLTWDGSTGNWDTDARWLPGGIEPTGNDNVTIDSGQVTIDQPGKLARNLDLGASGIGTLIVEAGGSFTGSQYTELGIAPGSTGWVTVTGAGSVWTQNNDLRVGLEGTGSFEVTAGASLVTNSYTTIASSPGSTGSVSLSGTGTSWTPSNLRVGVYGSGSLMIHDDAKVQTDQFISTYLGYRSGSTGVLTVAGAGSSYHTDSPLYVGYSGQGTMTISAGGSVTNNVSSLASSSGSNGTALVTGAGSTWTSSNSLRMGWGGTATLTIADGAVVNVGGQTDIVDGRATMLFDGGTLNTASLLASHATLLGTGTVNTNGLVADFDLAFDAGNGLQQTKVYNTLPDQNITVNLDVSAGRATDLGAGYGGVGTLTIADGVSVSGGGSGYLGYMSSGEGSATVTGTGSAWGVSRSLYIGYLGTGTLHIEDGGVVDVSDHTRVGGDRYGFAAGGDGTIYLDNGTLNTGSLWASPSDLRGSGTIHVNGLVADMDVVFNASYGLQQTIVLDAEPGQNIAVQLDAYPDHPADMGAGYHGVGTLTIADARAVSTQGQGFVGYRVGSTGTATVSGPGSSWTTRNMWVGDFGTGTLVIEEGGAVNNMQGTLGSNTDANGTAIVTGAGSSWNNTRDLRVGYRGTGTLRVESGAVVTSADGSLGNQYQANASGSVIVTGAGSMWNIAGGLNLSNNASLIIADGGAVSCALGMLYSETGSQATVTGTGSVWTTGYLRIRDNGTLNIEAGGRVTSDNGEIRGSTSDSSGSVIVTGAGSEWVISGNLAFGYYGSMTVESGGRVTSGNGSFGMVYGPSRTNAVSVSGAGSVWTLSGSLVGGSGTHSINVDRGGHVDIQGDLDLRSNTRTVGHFSYVLTSTADPLIDVGQDARLRGILDVDMAEGATLTPGDQFTLIDIGGTRTSVLNRPEASLLGTFNGVNLYLTYLGGDGNDVVAYALTPGDTDGDGDIDDADLGVAFANYTGPLAAGAGAKTFADGDTDGDGDVDDADLGNAFANYTGPLADANVPEPASLALFALGAAGLVRRRRTC